jgi:flavin-dependent dehydrogenase
LKYDAIVLGAGISGSICAKLLAENDYNVLLLDSEFPPRDKICSGVQIQYVEKIIGERIPDKVLCSNMLKRVYLETPSGKSLEGGISLLNFWRRNFDYWLNKLAIEAGADTRWGSTISDIKSSSDSVKVKIGTDELKARYLVGADGLSSNSISRRWVAPDKFTNNITGASMNYYFKGKSLVRPDTLYVFYRKDFSDIMYSWVFYKDELLVIGTSSTEKLVKYSETFFQEIKKRFNLKGEKIGQDGYSTNSIGGVVLGKDRVLLVGDAAGFLDLYRGVGMDTAALSGRICAKSLCQALETGADGLSVYQKRSKRLVGILERNIQKQNDRYVSNKDIDESFSFSNIIGGMLTMSWANIWNRFCKPEEIILLPP